MKDTRTIDFLTQDQSKAKAPFLNAISHHLPSTILTNEELTSIHADWSPEKVYRKTGIRERRIAAEGETAADLGYQAAEKLLERSGTDRDSIDALIFGSQAPDYFLPPSACILQHSLGLRTTCAAFDVTLGCSGFTYGLWLATSLVKSGSAKKVLLISADTYARYCDRNDLTTATLFGDGAGAALISSSPEGALAEIGPTIVGTDGSGAEHLIVRGGAGRYWSEARHESNVSGRPWLYMNGPEVFSFSIQSVKPGIQELLDRIGMGWDEIDWFLMHQANRYMLEQLRNKLDVPAGKMPIDVEFTGNTANASIPILISRGIEAGWLGKGPSHCVLAGFGVGFSWAMTYMKWL